jgi:hypothetical protein
LAARKPILGTSIAFRGYEVFAQQPNVFIADSPKIFADMLVQFAHNPHVTELSEPYLAPLSQLAWPVCLRDVDQRLRSANRFGWSIAGGTGGSPLSRIWLNRSLGWRPSPEGTICQISPVATLPVDLPTPLDSPTVLTLRLAAFADANHPIETSVALPNGTNVTHVFESFCQPTELSLILPVGWRSGEIIITSSNLWSPADLGLTDNGEKLGAILHSLAFDNDTERNANA